MLPHRPEGRQTSEITRHAGMWRVACGPGGGGGVPQQAVTGRERRHMIESAIPTLVLIGMAAVLAPIVAEWSRRFIAVPEVVIQIMLRHHARSVRARTSRTRTTS